MKVDAVILAAGQGTRMAPITNSKPKPLVLFRGKPLLCWTLDAINRHAERIVVVTKPFSDQYHDIPKSYPKVNLVNTLSSTMLGALWDGLARTSNPFIFCGSSDVVYSPSVVSKLMQNLQSGEADAIVALKTSYVGGEKRWDWVIRNGRVKKISLSTSRTPFERFCFLCRRDTLVEFREKMMGGGGSDTNRLAGANELGTGWIYLLGHLVDLGYKVNAEVMNDEWLQNVNRVSDLLPVD